MKEVNAKLQSEVAAISTTLAEHSKLFAEQQQLLKQILPRPVVTVSTSQSSDNSPVRFGSIGQSYGINTCQQHVRHKPASVDLLRFSGVDVDRWLANASRYFEFYDIRDEERLSIASFHFEGEAFDWYDWMHKNRQLAGWAPFAQTLHKRFHPADFEPPEGQLAKLRQTSTVDEYRAHFQNVMNRSMILPDLFVMRCFTSGLRDDVKAAVMLHEPTDFEDLINLAHKHKRRITCEQEQVKTTPGRSHTPQSVSKTQSLSSASSSTAQSIALPSGSKLPISRLSPSEIAQK